jgi:hypothetical protein
MGKRSQRIDNSITQLPRFHTIYDLGEHTGGNTLTKLFRVQNYQWGYKRMELPKTVITPKPKFMV